MKTLIYQIDQAYNEYFMTTQLRTQLLQMVKGLNQNNHIVLTSKILDFCNSSLKELDSLDSDLTLSESEILELKYIFMKNVN